MAFEQYTRCVQPVDWKPRSYWIITLQSLTLAPFTTVLVFGMAKPWCLLIVAEIVGLSWVIAYARHFLYHRLICLGGDRDVIGAIVSVSAPPAFTELDWDNDYSINLLLQNTEYGVKQAEAEMSSPYGYLIAPQPGVTDPPVSRPTPGHPALDKFGTGLTCATLHAEFEGAGHYQLMQVAEGMLGFAVAALIACTFLPWPADVIIAAGMALLAFLGFLFGAIASKGARPGSPSDVDPNLGTLETNDSDNEGHGSGAHIVFVRGSWVFDPLHDGWNEIHPIKVCTIIGTWDGEWSDPKPDVIERIRTALDDAQSDGTRVKQGQPEHQWQVHPNLDGCSSVTIE